MPLEHAARCFVTTTAFAKLESMKYRWSIAPAQPELARHLAKTHAVSPLLAQCLINRGFSEPEETSTFLSPRLKQLADPFLLPNMRAAIDRLWLARENDEKVVVFGDYDVDGVTSTTLLTEVLRELGWSVQSYLPHRMDEGYGLSQDGVDNCLAKYPTSLLLAVDCGSTAVESIASLKKRGTDVIVLDHHQVSSPAPEAVALVNPQLSNDDQSNFQELCSAGLAFKLAHALVKDGREKGFQEALEFDVRPLLDLVALGTVADLVPLIGENRIMVPEGLRRLETTQRPGLVALKEVAQVTPPLGTYHVGFQFGPRLNAAGRMENAEVALRLLLSKSPSEAEPMAQALESQNRERQQIDRSIAEQVTGAVRAKFDPERDYVIVEGQMLWHIGVVGIVASRVLREFYRPTIVLGGDGDTWRGSGRSIEGFDLAAALRECDDLLIRHGGHAMAAGLTIDPAKLDEFRVRINEIARMRIRPELLQPELRLDAETELAQLTVERLDELSRIEPTGQGNPAISLVTRGVALAEPPRRIGKENKHVKLIVTDGVHRVEALWWNAGSSAMPEGAFDIAFKPKINEFRGSRSVQLNLLDWQTAS